MDKNKKVLKAIMTISFLSFLLLNKAVAQETFEGTIINDENPSITTLKNVQTTKYQIQPGDMFSFSVYDEPTLLQPEINVRPDGYATIEPIGEVYVAGYDIGALTKILSDKMLLYIREPLISINIREFHPASIFIYGAVQKPGPYQQNIQANRDVTDSKNPIVKTDLTISNVISNAGGVNYDADLSQVTVTNSDGVKHVVNLLKLIAEGDTSQNILLRSGDSIYVPQIATIPMGDKEYLQLVKSSLFPEYVPVTIIGEVNKAGVYEVPKTAPFLSSAVGLASGYTIDANKKFITIFRKTPAGNVSRINVNSNRVDMVVRPNDLICVNGRKWLKVVRGADYINRFISPNYAIPNSFNSWADLFNPDRRYTRY